MNLKAALRDFDIREVSEKIDGSCFMLRFQFDRSTPWSRVHWVNRARTLTIFISISVCIKSTPWNMVLSIFIAKLDKVQSGLKTSQNASVAWERIGKNARLILLFTANNSGATFAVNHVAAGLTYFLMGGSIDSGWEIRRIRIDDSVHALRLPTTVKSVWRSCLVHTRQRAPLALNDARVIYYSLPPRMSNWKTRSGQMDASGCSNPVYASRLHSTQTQTFIRM